MAEKSTFENELPKKSTVKWLRGLDENGNPVLIDISDHATVVGGLQNIRLDLMSFKGKEIELGGLDSVVLGLKSGLLILSNATKSNAAALLMLNVDGTCSEIITDNTLSSVVETDNRICVIHNGTTWIIKNKYNESIVIRYALVDLLR